MTRNERTERFVASARAASAVVTMSTPAKLVGTLAGLLADEGLVLVAPDQEDLIPTLARHGVRAMPASRGRVAEAARGMSLEEAFRSAGAAVTGSLAAVAASGSVAVGPCGGNGGLLAALPPRHVVLVHERDISETIAEALAALAPRLPELGGELVFVTGPSRTADIEMLSVLGVHGPIRLDIVLIQGGEA